MIFLKVFLICTLKDPNFAESLTNLVFFFVCFFLLRSYEVCFFLVCWSCVWNTVDYVHGIVYSTQSTFYSLQFTVYMGQCTVYGVQ